MEDKNLFEEKKDVNGEKTDNVEKVNNEEKLNNEERQENVEGKKVEESEKKKEEIEKDEILNMLKESLKKGSNKNYKGTKRQLGGKFSLKGIMMLVFIVSLILWFSTNKFETKQPVKEISYTEFLSKVKDKGIAKVEEKEEELYGYTEDGKDIYKTRMITFKLGYDKNMLSAIEENNIPIVALPPEDVPLFKSLLISSFPMLLLIGVWIFMLNKMNGGGGRGPQIFNVGKSRAKENGENVSNITFDDVAGITEAKAELEEVVTFLREPDKFKNIGAKIPKGVLLLGAPGTGKTLLAKAVAGEAKVPFFSISGSEFVEMFVGVGASRVRDLFAKARKNSPCIIFIDEIDAVGRKRGTGQGGGNDEREQTLNQLLVEMDGFGTDETIIVIAATNRAEILDRALLRPGRFDRQVHVDYPDVDGREAILKVHAKGKKIANDVDLRVIAQKTPGFVGADLANLLNEAAILAARDNRKEITMADLEEASEKVVMGPEKKSKKIIEKERRITAYHEAGHALMFYLLPDTEPVHKITIVPRGYAGGYTLPIREEEKMYATKSGFLNDMRIYYGGRAAEEIIFGDITTGASNDIERATGIAHSIVTKYGMNSKFGPILLDNTKEGDYFQQKYYSDITGKEVDQEIFKLVNEMYNETVNLLAANKDKLIAVAETLLIKETLNRNEFEAIMRGETLESVSV